MAQFMQLNRFCCCNIVNYAQLRAECLVRIESNKMNEIKVIVADDHDFIRGNLCMKLGNTQNIKVIGEAANGQRAVELTRELKPDVIIMDVTMPVLNGIEATQQIFAEFPGTKIIGFSMHSDKEFVKEMLKAGAKGYLLKSSTIEELREAIHTVYTDQTYFGEGICF
jgi:two-component system nitrate/nitrite response regulator NarL